MSEWLRSLVGYMIMVSVVMQMLPNSKYEQYVKLFTGFLLILLFMQPMLRIGSLEDCLENKISQFVEEQERLEREIGKEGAVFSQKSVSNKKDMSLMEIPEISKVEVVIDD